MTNATTTTATFYMFLLYRVFFSSPFHSLLLLHHKSKGICPQSHPFYLHWLFCYRCFSVESPLSNCIVCSATPLSVPGYRCFTVSDGPHTWRHRSKIVQGQRSEHCLNKNSKRKYKYEIHTDKANHMNEVCQKKASIPRGWHCHLSARLLRVNGPTIVSIQILRKKKYKYKIYKLKLLFFKAHYIASQSIEGQRSLNHLLMRT